MHAYGLNKVEAYNINKNPLSMLFYPTLFRGTPLNPFIIFCFYL